MEFENYKERVLEKLKDFYGHDAEVTMHAVYKGNDTCRTGITVRLFEDENCISPIVYIDHLYSRYISDEMSLDDVISELVEMVEKANNADVPSQVEKLTEWEYVKDKIYPVVVCTELNEKYMESLVSKEYMDLSVLYNIRLMADENGIGSTKITKELFNKYGVSIEELHHQALLNLRNEGYTTKSMFQMLHGILDEFDMPEDICEEEVPDEMYVVTNERGVNGAAVILDADYFHEKFGDRCLYILPSSVNELIVVPDSSKTNVNDINNMIREVNGTCVAQEEVLSDHAYYYDGINKLIRCA